MRTKHKKNLIPADAKKLEHNHLAEGEATGHYHAAVADDVALYESGDTMLMDAPSGTDVTHQEHHTQTIPPGQYERRLVQEFDPFAEEIRSVLD
jgi:hypothetical protein